MISWRANRKCDDIRFQSKKRSQCYKIGAVKKGRQPF